MSRAARTLFLLGCLAITALAGPGSVSNLWNGLKGPYVEPAGTQVAAEGISTPDEEEVNAPR